MPQQNYYVLVRRVTGKMITINSQLPIYWRKDVAEDDCKDYKGCVVKKVNVIDLDNLIKNAQ